MTHNLHSLSEIAFMEQAYAVGVPALGRAGAALLERWRYPLRDEETLVRLAFLAWFQDQEPDWLTGLADRLPSVATLLAEAGGESAVSAEILFVLGLLIDVAPPLGSDEEAERRIARQWLEVAAEREPTSRVIGEWRYWIGEQSDTRRPRSGIERELHARFAGRGAVGDYVMHTLRERLRPDRARLAAP